MKSEASRTSTPAGKGALMIHSCVGAKITHCFISAWRGIETYNSSSLTVDACTIIAPVTSADSIGIMAGNGTMVLNCDITGYGNGVRHQNLGLTLLGGRYEVNDVGIMIGMDENGIAFQSSGFHIAGLSMELNGHGIYILAGGAGQIAGCAIACNVEGNKSGIYLHNAEQIAVSGVVVSNRIPSQMPVFT